MTDYRLAASGRDYAKAHELIRSEGLQQEELSFPTMLAWQGNELVGCLGTHITNKMIAAGPLTIKTDRPRYWTLIRLIENYENVMRAAGISSYIFSVEVTNTDYIDKIDKTFGLKPYAVENGHNFYIRKL